MNLAALSGAGDWHMMLYAFSATVLGAPMLLTVTAAATFGPVSLLFALVGVVLASGPLYLLGFVVRRLGLRLPARLEAMAGKSETPAIAAALTPSYALYWVVSALAGLPWRAAALGSLAVSFPLAVLFGVTTITGHHVGLPTPLVSAVTLAVFLSVRHLKTRTAATAAR